MSLMLGRRGWLYPFVDTWYDVLEITRTVGGTAAAGATVRMRYSGEVLGALVGTKLRLEFSAPVGPGFFSEIEEVRVGRISSATTGLPSANQMPVTFAGGSPGVYIAAGASVISDPLVFPFDPATEDLVVSVYFANVENNVTWGSVNDPSGPGLIAGVLAVGNEVDNLSSIGNAYAASFTVTLIQTNAPFVPPDPYAPPAGDDIVLDITQVQTPPAGDGIVLNFEN